MAIATINPATGETLKTYEPLSERRSRTRSPAPPPPARLPADDARAAGRLAAAAADVLDEDADDRRRADDHRDGQDARLGKAEVAKCAKALRWYAEHGPAMLEPRAGRRRRRGRPGAYVVHQPLGVVLAIMPWNFPLWQAMRFAAPALMAGNVGLLKHASNVPQTALYLEELFRKAGFPEDVFQTLLIGSGSIERVLRDDRVVAATLTGSAPAGQSVASIAGDALKPTVLELGGSDPFIVMPSAHLEKAAEVAVTARIQNNGQSCIAAKRFFVHGDVAEEFTRLFAEKIAALTVGDPMDPDTQIGPLATESGREDVEKYVDDAVAKGATAAGRREAGRRARVVLPADAAVRDHAGDGSLLRGGLRAGRGAVHRRRPRRGDRDRQQPPVRARRQPVERGRRRTGPVHPGHRLRHGVRQRHGRPATPTCPSAASSRAATAGS